LRWNWGSVCFDAKKVAAEVLRALWPAYRAPPQRPAYVPRLQVRLNELRADNEMRGMGKLKGTRGRC